MSLRCAVSKIVPIIWLALFNVVMVDAGKKWTYTFQAVEATSTNEELVRFDVGVTRLGRNEYTISGTCTVTNDILDAMVEITTYRSLTGNSDYKPLPLRVQKQNLVSFMNGSYKKLAMDSLKNCSNMPYFEDEFTPPLKSKVYEFNNCLMDISNMSDDMPSGFYQALLSVETETVNFKIMGTAKIDNILF